MSRARSIHVEVRLRDSWPIEEFVETKGSTDAVQMGGSENEIYVPLAVKGDGERMLLDVEPVRAGSRMTLSPMLMSSYG